MESNHPKYKTNDFTGRPATPTVYTGIIKQKNPNQLRLGLFIMSYS